MNNAGNTLDDFPPESFTILAFCDACEHRAPLDRAKVPADITVQELRGQLRFSRYGSRETSLRIVYTGAGGFRHSG
jgi:hypothetical protein